MAIRRHLAKIAGHADRGQDRHGPDSHLQAAKNIGLNAKGGHRPHDQWSAGDYDQRDAYSPKTRQGLA